MPTLLVASACDRLLPSLGEASRLAAVLPAARRVTLPDSGHTALLEEGVDLAALLARAGLLPAPGAAPCGRTRCVCFLGMDLFACFIVPAVLYNLNQLLLLLFRNSSICCNWFYERVLTMILHAQWYVQSVQYMHMPSCTHALLKCISAGSFVKLSPARIHYAGSEILVRTSRPVLACSLC